MIQQPTVIEHVIACLVGNNGNYWSASPNNNNAYNLNFNDNGKVNPSNNNNRANGQSVRCLQASVGGLLADLLTAYYCARKNKRNTSSQTRFERSLSDNLMRLYDDIVSGRYRVGRSMCFVIRDPVLREVFAAHMNEVLTAEYNPYRILSVLQSYAGYQRHFHNEW